MKVDTAKAKLCSLDFRHGGPKRKSKTVEVSLVIPKVSMSKKADQSIRVTPLLANLGCDTSSSQSLFRALVLLPQEPICSCFAVDKGASVNGHPTDTPLDQVRDLVVYTSLCLKLTFPTLTPDATLQQHIVLSVLTAILLK